MVGLTVLMYFQQFEDPKFQYIFQGEHIPKTLVSLGTSMACYSNINYMNPVLELCIPPPHENSWLRACKLYLYFQICFFQYQNPVLSFTHNKRHVLYPGTEPPKSTKPNRLGWSGQYSLGTFLTGNGNLKELRFYTIIEYH